MYQYFGVKYITSFNINLLLENLRTSFSSKSYIFIYSIDCRIIYNTEYIYYIIQKRNNIINILYRIISVQFRSI